MESTTDEIYDLAVIGAGLAGRAATLFAANRGLSAVQIGDTSELSFAAGVFDLFANVPGESRPPAANPWEGIDRLVKTTPDHPFAKLHRGEVSRAMEEVMAFLAEGGYPFHAFEEANQKILTPVGTLKTTYAVPETMRQGALAIQGNRRLLLVDFRGLKGFSAIQMAETLQAKLPGIRTATLEFPGLEKFGEFNCEQMARELELPQGCEKLAALIRPHVGDADAIGLPACLGIYRPEAVRKDLSERLGIPVFEIPTLSPSVPGLRIREVFDAKLRDKGVKVFTQTRISSVEPDPETGGMMFEVETGMQIRKIRVRTLILATGRFFGKGLVAEDGTIREALLDLPVNQPDNREDWFDNDFFVKSGHAINRCGVDVDTCMRPLRNGAPESDRLFACGGILAHQDWKREKSGAGVSFGTAFRAVQSVLSVLGKPLDEHENTDWIR